MNEANKLEINRLKWRSKRSMLEVDLYLDRFIQNEGLEQLNAAELNVYRELLELKDSDLLMLLQGKQQPLKKVQQDLISKIVI